MLWLCLRFPQLSLELFNDAATRTAEPEPAAVVDNQKLLVCNRAALAAGVRPGLTPATARALCGQITIFERDTDREAQTLQRLAYSCYGFTPAITCSAPDWLLLEIGSSLRLFGGIKVLLGKIRQQINQQQFSYRFGLAPTPKAAQLLSQLPSKTKPELVSCFDPLTGKLQQPQQFDALLRSLPLSHLPCEARLQKQFQSSGFATLGDLLALPRAALGRRFGKSFITYLQQVTGDLPDPQPALTLPPEFDDTLALSDAITAAEMLVFPMKRMLTALCGYLQGRQLQCQQLSWQLRLTDNSYQRIELTFSQPQNRLEHFLTLTRLRLENLRFTAPVDTLRLQVTKLHLAAPQTGELFADTAEPLQIDNRAADDLLDRLTTRLGSAAITTLALASSHIPELAWQPATQTAAHSEAGNLPHRPLWLFPQATVVSQPLHDLELLQGPERIEGNWWHQPVCRDYYIARHHSGARYWVYQDRISRSWFIHGAFG